MLRGTLSQVRQNAGRVVAAGVAVTLSVAFVAATLAFTATMERSLAEAVGASALRADAVVTPRDEPLDRADVARVAAVDGVAVAEPRLAAWRRVSWPGGDGQSVVQTAPGDQRLRWAPLVDGREPAAPGEATIDSASARAHGIGVGHQVQLAPAQKAPGAPVPLRVVGVVDTGPSLFADGDRLNLFVPAAAALGWPDAQVEEIVVLAAPGVEPADLTGRLAAAARPGLAVRTGADEAAARVTAFTGDVDVLSGTLLGFTVVALFVAAIVIANTFSILVAQRTRSLALLRCVGASRAQVYRSCLAEGVVLGVPAAALGVGLGLVAAAVAAAAFGFTGPGGLHVSAFGLVAPFAVGVVTTVLAVLGPAARATRIAPLAALSPVPDAGTARRIGRLRAATAVVLLVGGGAALVLGAAGGSLVVAMAGGVLSALGVVTGGPLLMPPLARAIGAPLRRLGVPGRLAVDNAVRNPGRAAATSTALFVGVTLIALLQVGSASTKATLEAELGAYFPLDAVAVDDAGRPLRPAVADALASVPGTAASTRLAGADATVAGQRMLLLGVDPAEGRAVTHRYGDDVAAGRLLLPSFQLDRIGLRPGDPVEVAVDGRRASFTVHASPLAATPGRIAALVTAADLATLAPGAAVHAVWLRSADADRTDWVSDLREAGEQQPGVVLDGAADERAQYDRTLGTILLIATGLLLVAVVIATVGIGNTLGLSVLERTRESALLRVLGLSRAGLRGSLAAEALLLAAAGAATGVAAGILYGWAGSRTLLADLGTAPVLAVPWWQLLLDVAVALAAGLLASVLPARRAARVQPAAALAEQ